MRLATDSPVQVQALGLDRSPALDLEVGPSLGAGPDLEVGLEQTPGLSSELDRCFDWQHPR